VRLDAADVVVIVYRLRGTEGNAGRIADFIALVFVRARGCPVYADQEVLIFSQHPRCLAGTGAPVTPALFVQQPPAPARPATDSAGSMMRASSCRTERSPTTAIDP
jgi:hypothetical protein